MAMETYQVCDECRRRAKRFVELDQHVYCSRYCYLAVCKRVFDERWNDLLGGSGDVRRKNKLVLVLKTAAN